MPASVRRYYDDSYATAFDATVLERVSQAGRTGVVLDATFFYPTSGGQPHDTGWLDDSRVMGVELRDDGAVLHLLDRLPEGDRVRGRIDWERRFDHMQQHTGQHVLSQAFVRELEAPTIGFHLGEDYVSIDLDAPAPAPEAAHRVFELANRVIAENVPVRAWFPDPDELAGLALRKTPEVDGALRVVAIGDFDYSACGGTHVARTGEVGQLHHLRTERLKRGCRIAFLAGDRARRDYATKHAITARISAQLTCSVTELPDAVARLHSELQDARRALARFEEAALDREAGDLVDSAPRAAGRVLVTRAWEGRPAEELRQLAMRASARAGVVALFGTAGERVQFVFARSEDLQVDLKPGLDAALAAIGGGRGGGSRIVQGGGGPAPLAQVERALAAAREALGS